MKVLWSELWGDGMSEGVNYGGRDVRSEGAMD